MKQDRRDLLKKLDRATDGAATPGERALEGAEELAFERLSDEQKYHRAVPGYMKRVHDLYAALYDRFGAEGLALIRDVSRTYGSRIAKNVQKRRQLKGVTEVGRYLLKVFDIVTPDWRIEEYSEDRLVISVSNCPYGFTRDEICQAHTCMEQALVAELDEDLDYGIRRSIPRGDRRCEHVLARRATAPRRSS